MRTLLAAGSLTFAVAFNAAAVSGLFNTGVDNAGVPLAEDVVDPHYGIVFPFAGVAYAATSAGGYPVGGNFPVWIGDTSTSAWISPFTDTLGPPGQKYSYVTTFTLDPAEVSTFVLCGLWTGDDGGLGDDIWINGISTGLSAIGGFNSWTPFSITSGFLPGLNTLQFDMVNRGVIDGPTGIRVAYEICVPESGNPFYLGAGLVPVLGAWHFRRRARHA